MGAVVAERDPLGGVPATLAGAIRRPAASAALKAHKLLMKSVSEANLNQQHALITDAINEVDNGINAALAAIAALPANRRGATRLQLILSKLRDTALPHARNLVQHQALGDAVSVLRAVANVLATMAVRFTFAALTIPELSLQDYPSLDTCIKKFNNIDVPPDFEAIRAAANLPHHLLWLEGVLMAVDSETDDVPRGVIKAFDVLHDPGAVQALRDPCTPNVKLNTANFLRLHQVGSGFVVQYRGLDMLWYDVSQPLAAIYAQNYLDIFVQMHATKDAHYRLCDDLLTCLGGFLPPPLKFPLFKDFTLYPMTKRLDLGSTSPLVVRCGLGTLGGKEFNDLYVTIPPLDPADDSTAALERCGTATEQLRMLFNSLIRQKNHEGVLQLLRSLFGGQNFGRVLWGQNFLLKNPIWGVSSLRFMKSKDEVEREMLRALRAGGVDKNGWSITPNVGAGGSTGRGTSYSIGAKLVTWDIGVEKVVAALAEMEMKEMTGGQLDSPFFNTNAVLNSISPKLAIWIASKGNFRSSAFYMGKQLFLPTTFSQDIQRLMERVAAARAAIAHLASVVNAATSGIASGASGSGQPSDVKLLVEKRLDLLVGGIAVVEAMAQSQINNNRWPERKNEAEKIMALRGMGQQG